MAKYTGFIPQNVTLPGVKKIAICNKSGGEVGSIALGHLTTPAAGDKLYSFGALADVHIVYDTATTDFARALTYLTEVEGVAFTCICGDLTGSGTEDELSYYKLYADKYSPNTPIYAISGNHESFAGTVTDETISPYTGQPLYYSITHGDDVFVMCGYAQLGNETMLTTDELQWLYETLEVNRNKRCFVFFHVFPQNDSGNPGELYYDDMFTGTPGSVFQSLLQHYKNTIFFHGHSHTKFYLQGQYETANYNESCGYRSVHIPSVTSPRDIVGGSLVYKYADSEGYVVDVYGNGIHLRGRDFVQEIFLPIASYWLDTTPQEVEIGTYTDDTGTVQNAALVYRLHANGTNYIVDGMHADSVSGIVVPVSSIDGIRVIEINNYAFRNNEDVTVVVMPDTITMVENYAFAGCTNLRHVKLSEGLVSSLYGYVFAGCTSLELITLPSKLTMLKTSLFDGCTALREVIADAKLAAIAERGFAGCTAMELYDFTACEQVPTITVTTFDSALPSGCEIRVPAELYYDWVAAEYWSNYLNNIEPPVKLVYRLRSGGANYIVDGLADTTDGGLVVIKATHKGKPVSELNEYAFRGCANITKVIIPEGLTNIETSVFYSCASLQSVTMPDSVTALASYNFYDCPSLESVEIGNGVKTITNSCIRNCAAVTTVTIGDGATSISSSAIRNCPALTSVVVGKSVASIGTNVFKECPALEVIDFSACEQVPAITSSTFGTLPDGCQILVPASLFDGWITANYWSEYAGYIVSAE